jgi:hypothetical protein
MFVPRVRLFFVAVLSWTVCLSSVHASPAIPLGSSRFSSVVGTVFEDGDGDGVPGGPFDRALGGIEVRLGAPCGREPLLYQIALADEAGHYRFDKVGRGCYGLRASAPAGYLATNSVTNEVRMSWGDEPVRHDIGLVLPGHVVGVVFDDANGNGIQDANEDGLANVAVDLYNDLNHDGILDASDVLSGTTTTEQVEGAFAFLERLPGHYLLAVEPPSGFVATTANIQAFLLVTGQGGGDLLYYFGLRRANPVANSAR